MGSSGYLTNWYITCSSKQSNSPTERNTESNKNIHALEILFQNHDTCSISQSGTLSTGRKLLSLKGNSHTENREAKS